MAVNQFPSLSTPASDPLRNFVWQVTLRNKADKSAVMGFMTVSGLGMTIDVIPYREGQMNTTSQQMPGQATFQPITMTEGVIVGQTTDMDWIQRLFTVEQGGPTGTVQNAGDDFRCWLEINVLDHPVTATTRPSKATFVVYNAWPTSIAWSDLDAGANQLLVEQVSFTHEGIIPSLAKDSTTGEATTPVFFAGGSRQAA